MINAQDYLGSIKYHAYQDVYNEAKTNAHAHWIGDIPVPLNLMKFYNEIKFKRPDIVVRIDKRPMYYNGKNYRVFGELALAYKDAPELECGVIGVEAGTTSSELLFVVESKRIKNEKFAEHSEGYRSKKTKDFVKATKNALQYIKPVTFEELRAEHNYTLESSLHGIREPAYNKLYQAGSVGRTAVIDEVRNMIRMGYQPTTQSFKDAFALIASEGDELERINNYKPQKCFVWMKPDRVEYKYEGADRVVAHDQKDVPEEIINKVSVLQIGNVGTPIMDVGVKVNATMYWLYS